MPEGSWVEAHLAVERERGCDRGSHRGVASLVPVGEAQKFPRLVVEHEGWDTC